VFLIILVLFIAVPIIEIGLFIQVGGFLGFWATIGLVLLSAVVGASLVRSQGLKTLMTVQQRVSQGEIPAQQILEGVLLAVSGVLLLTPGFMTDMLGMMVLLPGIRSALAQYLMTKVAVQGQQGSFNSGFHHSYHPNDDGNTYEGEYESKDDEHNKLR